MNRARRRRQQKKRPAPRPPTVAAIKAALQQLPSPTQIQQYLDTLPGLPPAARHELQVYAAEFHDATDIIHHGPDTTALLDRLVANAQSWADTIIDQSPQKGRRACHAGCAWCCYVPVVLVTAAEALSLAAWLRRHCTDAELDALRHRLATRLHHQQAPRSPRPQPPRACPLLDQNRCMAYEARPLKCRAWNSLRLTACEHAYGHSPSAQQVPIDAHAFVMGNAVLNGFIDSLTKAGLDGSHYELCQALAQTLEQSDGAQRWQRGEQVVNP